MRLNDWKLFDQVLSAVLLCLTLEDKPGPSVSFAVELVKFYVYANRLRPLSKLFLQLGMVVQRAGNLDLPLVLFFNALKFAFAFQNVPVSSPAPKTHLRPPRLPLPPPTRVQSQPLLPPEVPSPASCPIATSPTPSASSPVSRPS